MENKKLFWDYNWFDDKEDLDKNLKSNNTSVSV